MSESTGHRVTSTAAAALVLAGMWVAGAPQAQAAPSPCADVVGNLVTNCGFETRNPNFSPTGWTIGGNGGFVTSLAGFPNTGLRSLFLNFDAPGDAFASQTVGGAGTYDVSFWLMLYTGGVPSNLNPTLDITLGDQTLAVTVTPNNTQDVIFTEFRFTNVTTAAPATIRFATSGTQGGTQYYDFIVDDVVVTAVSSSVPEPSSVALVLASLGGLAASRRGRRAARR